MTVEHKVSYEAMGNVLRELRDAVEEGKNTPYVVGTICTAVANLIAGAGRWGGTGQTRMMRQVEQYDFRPEYYVDTIRVHYEGGQ